MKRKTETGEIEFVEIETCELKGEGYSQLADRNKRDTVSSYMCEKKDRNRRYRVSGNTDV